MDGAGEPELRERLGLALARAEAGAPEQPLSLQLSERSTVDRWRRHLRLMVGRPPDGTHPSIG